MTCLLIILVCSLFSVVIAFPSLELVFSEKKNPQNEIAADVEISIDNVVDSKIQKDLLVFRADKISDSPTPANFDSLVKTYDLARLKIWFGPEDSSVLNAGAVYFPVLLVKMDGELHDLAENVLGQIHTKAFTEGRLIHMPNSPTMTTTFDQTDLLAVVGYEKNDELRERIRTAKLNETVS